MRKTCYPALLFALVLLLSGCSRTEPTPVAFFFIEVCPGCESYRKAEELNGLVIALNASKEYRGRGWNMGFGTEEANRELMGNMETRNLPDISYALPLLFLGEEYHVGYEDIEKILRERVAEVRAEK